MSSRLPLLNSLQCSQCLVSTTFRIRRWRASAISCKVEESALRYRSTPSFPVLGAQSRYARSTIQPLLYGASECIDRVWLKQWEREMALLLEQDSCIPLSTNTILPCIYIFHSIHYQEQVLCNAAYSASIQKYNDHNANIACLMPPFLANQHRALGQCLYAESESLYQLLSVSLQTSLVLCLRIGSIVCNRS